MKRISRAHFFATVRRAWGPLNPAQVPALDDLLDFVEADDDIVDPRHAAYMLATTKHETAHTYRPIREYGRGRGRLYGVPCDGRTYYGRGFVQITWARNYAAMERLLGAPFVANPDLALRPLYAYRIMSIGMREGRFTGHALARYIHGGSCDYVRARKIINGVDRADLVAGYARWFERALVIA